MGRILSPMRKSSGKAPGVVSSGSGKTTVNSPMKPVLGSKGRAGKRSKGRSAMGR